jgi:hypothetical protein
MASSLEGSVAAVLSEVLNIPVDNTALAKRVVAAAGKGTIESFAVVCASFGEPSQPPTPPLPCMATHVHMHAATPLPISSLNRRTVMAPPSHGGFARARTSAHPSQSHSTTISKSDTMQCNQHMHVTTAWHGPYGIAFKTHHTHTLLNALLRHVCDFSLLCAQVSRTETRSLTSGIRWVLSRFFAPHSRKAILGVNHLWQLFA